MKYALLTLPRRRLLWPALALGGLLLAGCATAPPKDPAKAHYDRGFEFEIKHKNAEAIKEYREAIRLNPNYVDAYYRLCWALRALGKPEEGIAALRKVVELDPDYDLAYYNLGRELRVMGKTEEAIAAFRKSNELKPDYGMGHFDLGEALEQQGRTEEAIPEYREAGRLIHQGFPYFCLGRAAEKEGMEEEAIAAYRRYIELELIHYSALKPMAILLDKQNKRKEARVYWENVVKFEKDPVWIEWIKKRLAEPD